MPPFLPRVSSLISNSLLRRVYSEPGGRVQSQLVTSCPKSSDRSHRYGGDEAPPAEGFARLRVGEVDLGHRHLDRLHRVVERHGIVGEAARIEDHRLCPFRLRLVQPVDQMPFMVRLTHLDGEAEPA